MIEESIERYVRSSLFDYENDEEMLVQEKEKELIDLLSDEVLYFRQEYLIQLLQDFTNEEFYKKNLEFLEEF